MNAEEMINRYINEVGEKLPSKTRTDIEMELRSLIQDALEERSGNEKPSAETAAAVLLEFGAPATIAARYRPAEVLIGPALFPTYRYVLAITVSIVAIVHMAGTIFSLVQNQSPSWGENAGAIFGSFWESILLNAAIVTVIFAIIERVGGDKSKAEWGLTDAKQGDWDPYTLPPVKDPDRINYGELIGAIVVNLFLIGGLNFFYDSIGYIDLDAESRTIVGLLADGFRQFVPWLTAAWALDILLKMMVLAHGRWNRLTRWLEVGIGVFDLYVLAIILMSAEIAKVAVFTMLAKLIIGIIVVIVVIDLMGKLYRLLSNKPAFAQALPLARLV